MAPITSLAPELIQRVLEFSEPPDHLNLALTCRTLHQRLDYILRYSQECHKKYRVVSDIEPSTIPDLVRAILIKQDWVAAWHIQAIEIWGNRHNFDDWRPYYLISPDDESAAGNSDSDSYSDSYSDLYSDDDGSYSELYQEGYFTEKELAMFKKAMVEILKIPEEFVDEEGDPCAVDGLVEDIKEGGSRFLAVLLMALSPRLQAIRFVRGNPSVDWTPTVLALAQCIKHGSLPAPTRIVPKTWRERDEERREREEETGLKEVHNSNWKKDHDNEWKACKESVDLPDDIKRQWPSGFLSVKEVAVGLPCRAFPVSDRGPEAVSIPSEDKTNMTHVAPLMRLPCLESLWIHGFSDESEEALNEPHGRWNLPLGCSAIKTLVFDYPDQPEYQPIDALIEACGRLEHLAFIGGNIGEHVECDLILGMCRVPRAGQTVKSILWCDTEVRGYRSSMFNPDEHNDGNPTLTISVDDLVLGGVGGGSSEPDNTTELKGFVWYLYNLLENSDVEARVITKEVTFTCSEDFFEKALIGAVRRTCWNKCWDRNMNMGYDKRGKLKEDAASGDKDGKEDSDAEKEDKNEDQHDNEVEQPFPCGCLPSWENHNQYPYFPNKVPALYLEDLDRWLALKNPWKGEISQPPDAPHRDPTKRPFGELIRLCGLWGVEIHTRTTPAPRAHNAPMPTVASEKDLETSPWYKHPDVERLYFKPHKGMVDDCGNCGECEECYKLHPAECWAKWKEDDAQADEERQKREGEEAPVDKDDGGGGGRRGGTHRGG